MSLPNPSWFPDASDPDGQDAWHGHQKSRLAGYEERAIKKICAAIGVRWQDLLDISRTRGDEPPRLHFPLFNAEVDFPIQLGVGNLVYLHELAVGDLFRRFDRTPVVRSFLALAESFDSREAMGMVFEWPHVAPFMAIHTFPSAPRRPEKVRGQKAPPPDVRVVAEVKAGRGKRLAVVMEPLDALLRCF